MRNPVLIVALAAPLLATGCIAKTAVDVVTAPVKIVGKGVDLATTSQSEADEKRGRALRKREEELGRLARKRNRALDDCEDGDRKACREAQELSEEIEDLQYEPI